MRPASPLRSMDGTVAHPLSEPAPLNLFQRLVLQWDRLHPYNAAQAWLGTQTHMWRMADSSRSAHGYSSTVEDIFVRGISR